MARPAAETPGLAARVIPLLRPFPGRAAQALRLSAVAALTAWLALYWGLPEAALAAYVAFFMWKPDRLLGSLLAAALVIVASLLIGTVLLLASLVLDDPMWRVATIATASFAVCWLGSASKLKPIAPIAALVMAYALDLLGANPLPVFTTKALLWAWWLAGTPALVTIVVNLLFAPSPRRLLGRHLAQRLEVCAAALTNAAGGPARLEAALRDDPGQAALWLALARWERSSSPADIAAFDSALRQSMAIALAAKAIVQDGTPLAPERAAAIAAHLREMAGILARGLYPTGTALVLPDPPAPHPQAAAETALLSAMAGFTTAEPMAPATGQARGFLASDAFTNPAHVHFALKASGAAMICFLLYHALSWPGIHTAFLTCFIVALPTAAEAVEKLSLRMAGALIGAVIGMASLLLVVPVLDSGAQLAVLVLVATLPAAWLAVGSERISYVGFQWALAFYLTVIQGSGPGYDITIARDRVIGILLGNIVSYLVFTRVWPVSIAPQVDAALREGVSSLRKLAGSLSAAARAIALNAALVQFAEARRGLAVARYEPAALLPAPQWRSERERILDRINARLPDLYLASEQADGAARAMVLQLEHEAAGLFDPASPTHAPHPLSPEAAT